MQLFLFWKKRKYLAWSDRLSVHRAFRIILRKLRCINWSRVDVLSTGVTLPWRDSFCPGSSCIRHLRQLELSRWHDRVIGISVAGWKPNKIYPSWRSDGVAGAEEQDEENRGVATVVPRTPNTLCECKIGFW